MNAPEARRILQGYRPDSVDAGDPAFAEALALVATNAALRAWFEREQKFNRALVAGQEDIPVPAGLRKRLLATGAAPRPVWRRPAAWWGVAACLAISGVIAALSWPRSQQAVADSPLADFAIADAGHPKTHGGHGKAEAELKSTLKQPATRLGDQQVDFATLLGSGCRAVHLDGRDVLEVCFKRNGAGLHYYIARREDFPTLTAASTPVVVDKKSANLVVWADTTHLYIVVTNLDRALLEKLL